MKHLPIPRLLPAGVSLLFLLPLLSSTLNPGAAFAAPPPAKKVVKKTPPKKHALVKKAVQRKKPTRLIPKPLPKPKPRPTPRVVVPAPRMAPVPSVLVPTRPVPAPVPAPLPPAQTLIPAQMNVPLPLGGGTLTLVKMETTQASLPNLFGPNPPDAGTQYVVFTLRIKNETQTPLEWSLDTFNPQLRVAGSGDQKPLRGIALLTAADNKFEKQPIGAGEEKTLRFHFQVPLNAVLQTLTIGVVGSSTYQFDLGGSQR